MRLSGRPKLTRTGPQGVPETSSQQLHSERLKERVNSSFGLQRAMESFCNEVQLGVSNVASLLGDVDKFCATVNDFIDTTWDMELGGVGRFQLSHVVALMARTKVRPPGLQSARRY